MFDLKSKKINVCDVNSLIIENTPRAVRLAEESFREQVMTAAKKAYDKRIVLLSGPSGSGKTTTAQMICAELQKMGKVSRVISLDDFYVDRVSLPIINGSPNAEVVESLNLKLLDRTIQDVLDDGHTFLPRYDFPNGVRIDRAEEINVGTDSVLIFEGLHALNPLILAMVPQESLLSLYVSQHTDYVKDGNTVMSRRDMRFLRRMIRDWRTRGATPSLTFSMWGEVCRGEDEFIRPLGRLANMLINSSHVYEPGMLRVASGALLNAVDADDPLRPYADELTRKLGEFEPVGIGFLPYNSLLREFLG